MEKQYPDTTALSVANQAPKQDDDNATTENHHHLRHIIDHIASNVSLAQQHNPRRIPF